MNSQGFPNWDTEECFMIISNDQHAMSDIDQAWRMGWLNVHRIKKALEERIPMKDFSRPRRKKVDYIFLLLEFINHMVSKNQVELGYEIHCTCNKNIINAVNDIVDNTNELTNRDIDKQVHDIAMNVIGAPIMSDQKETTEGYTEEPCYNGLMLKDSTDEQIFNLIRKQKGHITALDDVKETKAAKSQIAKAKANIKSLVAYVDSRHEDS